ncbi:MAG: hypothetical protein M3Q08_11805 [Pseudomonadota bacterium]|nr:hypothetical protein [Pseudomonadota bacterium]
MADVLIIYPADKQTAATRLSEAIGSAGYSVTSREVSDPGGFPAALDQASTVKAALLIWSRSLVSWALREGNLARLRKQKNVVEVSADGITPLSEGDTNRVALISGWRGQPFHPGWQRILSDLARLCGAPPAPVEHPSQSSSVEAKRAEPAERSPAATEAGSTKPPRRFATAAIAVVAMLGLAIGAVSWISRSNFQANAVSRPKPETAAPARLRPIRPSAVSPNSAQPNADTPLQTASAAPARSVAEPMPKNREAAAASAPAAAELPTKGSAGKKSAPDRKARETPVRKPRPPTKRYSRQFSETMRLFCERSGRSTPQCRTFRQSTRAARP